MARIKNIGQYMTEIQNIGDNEKNIMINLTSAPHYSHTPYFRIFAHLLWELPHNIKNIAHFWNLHNINYYHTLLISLQLHHYTTIGPPSYISSILVYICMK